MFKIDLKKRFFQRMLCNFIRTLRPDEWETLAGNNVNIYEFFLEEAPDLFYKMKRDGFSMGIGEDDLRSYISEQQFRETISGGAAEYFYILDEHITWFREQLEYFLLTRLTEKSDR